MKSIFERISIRKFKDKEVEKDKLEKILTAQECFYRGKHTRFLC